jgi:hypothetical protein
MPAARPDTPPPIMVSFVDIAVAKVRSFFEIDKVFL